MQFTFTIFVADSDAERRQFILDCLTPWWAHLKSTNDVNEVIENWPKAGMILVHDEGDNVDLLHDYMNKTGLWLPIIVYSQEPTTDQIVKSILNGAMGFIKWPATEEKILHNISITKIKSQNIGNRKKREAEARSRVARLTARERQVLFQVADGYTNKEMADKMSISPRTVEIHRSNLIAKLGVGNTSDAIRIAIESSIVW